MLLRKILHLLLILLFLWPSELIAQVSFSTIADKQSIGLTDLLQVQFIAENATEIESFEPPAFTDFTILQGPIETNGMSLINGEISRYRALTFIIKPVRKGKLVIQGATALINGKQMKSNQLRIEVGDATSRPANPYPIDPGVSAYRRQIQEEYMLLPGESATEKIKKNLLVVLDLDKTTVYVGEPIVATYKLLTRLRSDSRISKRPSMNGFSVYDMVEPDGAGPSIETRDGKDFQSHIIRKTQLFPLQEGSFELEPVELENTVRFLRTDHPRGSTNRSSLQRLMDDLMGEESGSWEEHPITIASLPRTIKILPLPGGAPTNFSGAVGKFRLSGKAATNQIAAGENILYELTIEGAGNLPLINAPSWELPDGFTVFDPTVTEELNKTVSPMEGKKIVAYTVTPEREGKYTLPGIQFSYFDPASKSYKSLQTDSLQITVTPALNKPTVAAETTASPGPGLSSSLVWIIGAGLLIFALMIWLLLGKRKAKTIDAAPVAVSQPLPPIVPPIPVDYLAPAKAMLDTGDTVLFYKHLEDGLWQFLGRELQLSPASWQKETALTLLEQKGCSQADRIILSNIWQRCEWALYAPSLVSGDKKAILEETESLLNRIKSC